MRTGSFQHKGGKEPRGTQRRLDRGGDAGRCFLQILRRENRASGMETSGQAGDGEIWIGAGRKRPSLVLTNLLGKGQGYVMVRLRDAVMAIALATGGVGCATFCDECDDFPSPGGPGGYSMMPGTYTGPPAEMSSTTGGPAAMATDRTPSGASGASGTASPASEAAPTPPPAPSATAPAQGGGATSRPTGPGGAASLPSLP